jgi:hypothetical protein
MLTSAVYPVYGRGAQDPDLSRVDRLIDERQYNQAIVELSEYFKAHPDDFAVVQRRFQRIIKLRGDFNSLANEFLDTIANRPDDMEKILDLIRRLEVLESPRNLRFQAFISRTRALAEFAVNRNRLLKIMEEGRALIGAEDYRGALNAYAGGLDIYREEFFASGYGELVESRVRQGIESVNGGIRSFPAAADALNGTAAELSQGAQRETVNAAAGPSRIGALYAQFLPAADRFLALRQTLSATAAYFDEQLARIQEADSSIGDRSFLSFASRLIQGNPGDADGMLGALEACWDHAVSPAEAALERLAGQSFDAALADTRARNYDRARTGLNQAGQYIGYSLALADKWPDSRREGTGAARTLFGVPVPNRRAADFLAYQSLSRALVHMAEGVNLGSAVNGILETETNLVESWQRGTLTAETILIRERENREHLAGFLSGLRELAGAVGGDISAVEDYRQTLAEPDTAGRNAAAYLEKVLALAGDFQAQIDSRTFESAVRYYTIANGELEDRLNSRRREYEEGNRLIQGTSRTDDSGGTSIVHYPAEGLAVLSRMEQAIAADTQWGSSLIGWYQAEPREALADEKIGALYGSAQELLRGLENLRGQGGRLAATARTQASQAEAYRIDGQRLYQEARNALGQNNFSVARERIERAMERFNESLAIQESASLRAEWDTQLVSLAAEINRIENQVVIREVRNLVNNARTAYFDGNLEQAEDMLVRAQNRWKTTNVGEDTEVQYWITIVRGALSLRSGRTISPTAPLYAEMSQLLSDARKSYEEGARYFAENRQSQGKAKFSEALRKIEEVKLMFPFNQDAGLLELRIEQIIDPSVFSTSFDRRFAAAVAGTSPDVQSLESFAELQNLALMNPGYPGMSAAMIQAEINMGYRPPPPDPRALARSNELTNAARRILEADIRSQFEIGLLQVNEALQLNPNNNQAMIVKDQIQTRMNGTGTFALDSRSEAEYQRALSEFQRGNYLISSAIVEQLLQDPKNRSSTRILELQRRIQPLL